LKISCSSKKWPHFIASAFPERVVHAKGSGAHGYFACTNPDLPSTPLKTFQLCRKENTHLHPLLHRRGEKGSADTERDPAASPQVLHRRGNWDMTGTTRPSSLFPRSPKFGDFIHTPKSVTRNQSQISHHDVGFWSLSPESSIKSHPLSDRAPPHGYRHMDGFSSHTYSLINDRTNSST